MPTLAIQPGALIFVTGVNGLIGSHVADQLLARGYNVRGAVRDVGKSKWLADYFSEHRKEAKFELSSVPDMTVDGCYDEVVKGTDGFVHVASPLTGQIPKETIPIAVKGGINALEAAKKTPSIKRFVYTSSSIAATYPQQDVDYSIDQTTWNDIGAQLGWDALNQPEGLRGLYIYSAIKVETEKAVWKWYEENKPAFALNSILPNANFGKVLVPEHQGAPSTVEWAKCIFTGQGAGFLMEKIKAQYFIDVIDDALLHVSALIHSEPNKERIFGFAEPFNWNIVLGIYRKQFPDRKFIDDIPNPGMDTVKVPKERAEELLKWVKEGKGWTGLEESVQEMAKQWV